MGGVDDTEQNNQCLQSWLLQKSIYVARLLIALYAVVQLQATKLINKMDRLQQYELPSSNQLLASTYFLMIANYTNHAVGS